MADAPTPQQALADPAFHELPVEERRKVLLRLDPDHYGALPEAQQWRVLDLAKPAPATPPVQASPVQASPTPSGLPAMPQPPLPPGLMPEPAANPAWTNPATGVLHPADDAAPFGAEQPILHGADQIAGGFAQAAEPELRQKALGVTKMLGGAMQIGSMAIPATAGQVPLKTALTLGTTAGLQEGTEALLNKLGLPPEYAGLAGTIVGLLGGGKVVEKADETVLRARVKSILQSKLNSDFAARQAAERAARPQPAQPSGLGEAPATPPPDTTQEAEFEDLPNAPKPGPPPAPEPPTKLTPARERARQAAEEITGPPEQAPPAATPPITPEAPAPKMPTPPEVLADPDFHELPRPEQTKVLATIDPRYAELPAAEQAKVLDLAQAKAPQPGQVDRTGQDIENVQSSPTQQQPQEPEREPGWVGKIPTSDIQVDAPRFQFKANVGQGGAGDELRDVTKYDPEKAGILSVWKDPADGQTYVVNGHHRHELAERAGAPEETVRYLDAENAQQARVKGALINIAEGRGESTDAAKVFRDSGMTQEELAQEGVSVKGKVAKEGLALSKLAQPIFDDVIDGSLPAARGAVIGAGVEGHADQKALYDLIQQRERGGKRMTNDQVEELIRLNDRTPTKTENSADARQGSMFGDEEMTRSLLPEKAEVSDYVRKQLGAEKKLFGAVSTQGAAEKLSEGGNVIDAGKNAQVSQRAGQGIQVYDKLSQSAGPIDGILNQAARRLSDGENPSDVKQQAYRDIRASLQTQTDQLTGVPQRSDRGPQGLDRQGALPSHGSDRGPAGEVNQPHFAQDLAVPFDGSKPRKRGEVFPEARWSAHPARGERPPLIRVNRQAMDAVNDALGRSAGGLQMTAEQGAAVAQALHDHVDKLVGSKLLQPETAAHIRALAETIRSSAKASGAILYHSDRGVPLTRRAQVLLEENVHARQAELEGDRSKDARVQLSVLQHPAFPKASAALRADPLYRNVPARTAVHEITAKLQAGSHAEVNLSLSEGRDLLDKYYAALEKQHGPQSERIIGYGDRGTKIAARLDGLNRGRGIPAEVQRRSPFAEGGTGLRGEVLPGLEKGRQSGARQANAPEPGRGTAESPGRNEPLQARSDQPTLFDSGEEDRLSQASARDREKLQGERLTAQFKAPVTREEQLRKLKRGAQPPQTSLFEKTPEKAQRGLFDVGQSSSLPERGGQGDKTPSQQPHKPEGGVTDPGQITTQQQWAEWRSKLPDYLRSSIGPDLSPREQAHAQRIMASDAKRDALLAESKRVEKSFGDIIDQGEYNHYGLRFVTDVHEMHTEAGRPHLEKRGIHRPTPPRVGETLGPSWEWDDGDPTDEQLSGTSAVSLGEVQDAEDFDQVLRRNKFTGGYGHVGGHVALVGSSEAEEGNDPGEIILRDPRVLAVAKRADDVLFPRHVRTTLASLDSPAQQSAAAPTAKVADRLLAKLRELEPKGNVASAERLRRSLPDLSKAEFDQAAAQLARDRKVFLHDHGAPHAVSAETREQLVKQTHAGEDHYYVGMALRQPSAVRDFLSDESGSASTNAATLGLHHLLRDDVVPKAQEAAKAIVGAKDSILKVFAPAARGESAKTTALTIRKQAADQARRRDRAEAALKVSRKYFASVPLTDRYEFIDRVENGRPQKNLHDEAIAKVMRTLLDGRRDDVQALGAGELRSFYTNYFPHMWKETAEAEKLFQNFGKAPLEGSKAFLKQRLVPTIKDGLNAGLTPLSNNPVDLVLMKLGEMDKFITAHRVMTEMDGDGNLSFVKSGETPAPGMAKIDDPIATARVIKPNPPRYGTTPPAQMGLDGMPKPEPKTEGAETITGHYYAPEPAARVINNYLSPGLRGNKIFQAYLGLANSMNQFQLGWSAFHLGFTSVDAAVSKFALGVYQVAHGHPGAGLKSMLQTPLAPVANVVRGGKMLDEWRHPGSQPSEIATLVDAMVQAGGRARMDGFYRTHITDRMMDAFRAGNVLGGVIRAPFAATEQAMRPIMEYLVPRQKMGVFADMARFELDRLGKDATEGEKRAALAKAWDSVDNRMGQLVYDNLFWNKTAKDLAMASIRSVGWNVGTVRELLGGAADTLKFGKDAVTGKKPDFTWRMSYLLALPIVVGLAGALYQYLKTGKGPQELKDYFLPLNGETDENGKPERSVLPSYVKDVLGFAADPKQTALNKIHPAITTILEMLRNKDYFGTEIRNPDDPIVKQALSVAKDAAGRFEPMAARNLLRERKEGASAASQIEPLIGITRASRAITQTKAEGMLSEYAKEAAQAHGERTQDQVDRSRRLSAITRELRLGKDARPDIQKAFADHVLHKGDLARIQREARSTPLQVGFNRLTAPEAMRVYGAATPKERAELQRLLKAKLLRGLPNLTPAQTVHARALLAEATAR